MRVHNNVFNSAHKPSHYQKTEYRFQDKIRPLPKEQASIYIAHRGVKNNITSTSPLRASHQKSIGIGTVTIVALLALGMLASPVQAWNPGDVVTWGSVRDSDADQAAKNYVSRYQAQTIKESNPWVRVIDQCGFHSFPEDDCVIWQMDCLKTDLIVECARITVPGPLSSPGTVMLIATGNGKELPQCAYGAGGRGECLRPDSYVPPSQQCQTDFEGPYITYQGGIGGYGVLQNNDCYLYKLNHANWAESDLSQVGDIVTTTHATIKAKQFFAVTTGGSYRHRGKVQTEGHGKVIAKNYVSSRESSFLIGKDTGPSVEVVAMAVKERIFSNEIFEEMPHAGQRHISECGHHDYPEDNCLVGPKIDGLMRHPKMEQLEGNEDHIVCQELTLRCRNVIVFGRLRVEDLTIDTSKECLQSYSAETAPCPFGFSVDDSDKCFTSDSKFDYGIGKSYLLHHEVLKINRFSRLTVEGKLTMMGITAIHNHGPLIVSESINKQLSYPPFYVYFKDKMEVRDFVKESGETIDKGNEAFKEKIRGLVK